MARINAFFCFSLKYRVRRNFLTFCGGTLITDRHIITAAHCLKAHRPHELYVGVGDWSRDSQDWGEVLSAVVRIAKHPQFDQIGFKHDVAVLELAQRIQFDRYKRPAALAKSNSVWIPQVTQFTVSGWGSRREGGRSSLKLRQATMPYVDFEHCKRLYSNLRVPFVRVTHGMICAGKTSLSGNCLYY